MKEWSPEKKWNPFNSFKLLAQVYRWRLIQRGKPCPQPSLITVDPINKCNLKCQWCNANYILNHNDQMLDGDFLLELADFLPRWQGSPEWPAGVEAICVAGGGEPLLHPRIGPFIDRVSGHGVEVGVVTNGSNMDKLKESLAQCTWVGVSVDAGTRETYKALKGFDFFDKVCHNIEALIEHTRRHPCRLGSAHPGYGVSYKFLLTADNIDDIVPAVQRAKAMGCRNFHLRPSGLAWDRLATGEVSQFSGEMVQRLQEAFDAAREYEDDAFGIFGITHKFDQNLNRANIFSACYAVFMTAVVMPGRQEKNERFRFGLCCDRRGDARLEFGEGLQSVDDIARLWSSEEHWKIFEKINLNDCPRCTYQPHNQIYEHVIKTDGMTYKFI
ncbi:MAG: radical SAM protein [Magnetococcus sp. DMHC-1]|nr:radical SAM protein [Magnetococcales bacterium]